MIEDLVAQLALAEEEERQALDAAKRASANHDAKVASTMEVRKRIDEAIRDAVDAKHAELGGRPIREVA